MDENNFKMKAYINQRIVILDRNTVCGTQGGKLRKFWGANLNCQGYYPTFIKYVLTLYRRYLIFSDCRRKNES